MIDTMILSFQEWFSGLSAPYQALIATLFSWSVTALGASLVFFFKTFNQKALDGMMGFAAGVMIAASFWSLLSPSIILAKDLGYQQSYLPALIGFLTGGFFLAVLDKILPHLHSGHHIEESEGIKTNWQSSLLLVLAITLHNIPEGLAIGVAFGSVEIGLPSANIGLAVALSIGIAIQNFPEGTAVSVPLRRQGMSRMKSFLFGQASGIVEPFAGVLGALLVLSIQSILPYALSFAAGAMMFVVIEELIPLSHQQGNTDFATICTIVGFSIMMVLDVALG